MIVFMDCINVIDIHYTNLVVCPPGSVLGGDLDRAEPVHGDEEHGELGDEADRVVNAQPEVAQDGPQFWRPVPDQNVDCVERHRNSAYEHVRDRQWGDEKIGRLSDLSLHDETDKHEKVAKGGDDNANGQADRDHHSNYGAERSRPAFGTAWGRQHGFYRLIKVIRWVIMGN